MLLSEAPHAATPAQVDLAFAAPHGGRTFVGRQRVAYPFHVGRSLYLPGDPPELCTLYLQSCSGGIFEHDRLGTVLAVGPQARAHVTTAASTVVHAMPSGHAEQTVLVEAAEGALAEYLPDPLILFPRARLESRVTVRAHPAATVVVADSFLAHDPGGTGEPFGHYLSETRVETETGELLALDRFSVAGTQVARGQVGVQPARSMQATVVAVHRADPERALAALRSALAGEPTVYAGASLLPGGAGAYLRALSADAVALRRVVRDAWQAVRESVAGLPCGPRRK